jgi:ATP-dependent helicase/nuclease subunit B
MTSRDYPLSLAFGDLRMGVRLLTGTPPALESALAAGVGQAQADDPLAPVGVLLGGTLQRPYLQRRLAVLNDGIANVRFLMPSEFAMELGERRVVVDEGKLPLPPLADRILLREISATREGDYFEPVKDTPGLADAFHRLVRELRGAGYDASSLKHALRGSCEVKAKEKAIAETFAEFLSRRDGFYGPDECLLAREPERTPWEALFVHGIWQASPELVSAILEVGETIPVTVLFAESGQPDVDAAHADFREMLLGGGAEAAKLPDQPAPSNALTATRLALFASPGESAPQDHSLKLLSAPDPAREVRDVARHCLAWAREGIGFHEMAVVYRHPEPYRSIIESVFQEAGVPAYLHEGTPMSERPLGRRAIALLELADSEFERRAITDFLADGKLPEKTWEKYGKPTASTWDRFSRKAGVVRGFDQWEERLEHHASKLEESDRDWDKADAPKVREFLAFIRDLHSDLQGLPAEASWSEHLTALDSLLHRYIDDPDPILGALSGLGRFDALGGRTTRERFRQAVISGIENLRTDDIESGSAGAFGLRGVNVLDVNSLRHLRFRAVAVVGLAERSFPSPPRPDPILLDDERLALNKKGPAPIPLRVRGADPEPLQFVLATYAASERFLASFARKGSGDSRPQLPSRFFRALAEAATGRRVAAQKVDDLPNWLYERASGSRIGASDLDKALSLEEYDRTLIERHPELGQAAIIRAEPRFARALESKRARRSSKLTEFDGVLGPEARKLLPKVWTPRRGVSPSLLESYAACPQGVFVGSVLGAREQEEPEMVVRLGAGDRGTLLHEVLELFLAREPSKGEERIHGKGEEKRLLAIADEVFARFEERGATGFPAIWEVDRLELIEDLKAWLASEREDEVARRLSDGGYEIRFGYGWGDNPESDGGLSQDEPLEIKAGSVKLKVSGRIDRLNWDPERGSFRVVDYKTGSDYGRPKDGALGGGGSIQLPIYMLAAARMLGMKPTQGSAEYHYSTRRGGFKRGRFSGDDFASRKADLEQILAEIVRGMEDGVFHMAAKGSGACTYCVANPICPTTRFRQIERKQGSAANAGITRIRGIEP